MNLFIVALIFSLMTSCGKSEEKNQIIRPVRTQKVTSSTNQQKRTFPGLTRAGVESKLSFKVSGTVQALMVKLGDKVRTGDIIAKLDPYDYTLRVQEAEAAMLQAEAQERNAAANYSRIRDLYETRSASRTELDASRAQAESAKAGLDAVQKKLDQAKAQLNYATLKAPIDGNIASVDIEINENVSPGQTIVILNSGTDLEVSINIPENLIFHFKEGNQATLTFDSIPGKKFEGKITEVGIMSHNGTTFPVTVKLMDQDDYVRSGMTAEATFDFFTKEKDQSFFVEPNAVLEEGGKRYLYVVEETEPQLGIVHKKEVVVGNLSNEGLEIISGINEGELIVTAGLQFLSDGQTVRLLDN